ncbi:MAG: DEAD/DEAH box helicase family protein [Myxococcota bacterium]|nr:DEAD/DEAH box helicase family protein [Myxococcota bacterium]
MGVFESLSKTIRLPPGAAGGGLRDAQIAAIHAVAAHFWDSIQPALVVMPTGSGKTAVMIASAIVLRATRVLVVSPNRLLREQLVEKFEALQPLRELGALGATDPGPLVHEVTKRITTKKGWASLTKYDVVIGVPMSISPGLPDVAEPPTDLFDLILFDEAHHRAAPSYAAIAAAFPKARQVQFTATPFRRDQRRIPGDLIFTYELARARRDGVYGELKFCPVKAEPGDDKAIATAAAAQLRADKAAGLDHRLVVRAESRSRSTEIARAYASTKLKLKVIHSGLSSAYVKRAVADLVSGKLEGVIAVDMLGEGFDLPNLKVAALHHPHKTLAVTLQFIGRFARTKDSKLGTATFFAIPGEVAGEAARLFVPGAEWNEIVEDMSRARIDVEKETRKVIDGFSPVGGEADDDQAEITRAQLWSLRPFVHAKVYEVLEPPELDVELELPSGARALFTDVNTEQSTLVCVWQQTVRNKWSDSDVLADVTHDLAVVHYVQDAKLVFVCTTRRVNTVYDAIIESVAGQVYRRLAPDEVNRVLKGLDSLKIFNAGMRNRAGATGGVGESYRISSGSSVDRDIDAVDTATYDQGHAMCSGTENGSGTVIGFSTASKIWSNKYAPIAALLTWFRAAAKKLRDDRPMPARSMFERLGVPSRLATLPSVVVGADLPAAAYSRPTAHVAMGHRSAWLLDLEVVVLPSQTSTELSLVFSDGNLSIPIKYDITKVPQFTGGNAFARAATLTDATGQRGDDLFVAFLNAHPPTFFLNDLSTVVGDNLSSAPGGNVLAIRDQIEAIDWAAGGINPHLEKPAAGRGRKYARSLFEYVESRLKSEKVSVLFFDDSSNEVADYVAVRSQAERVLVQLFHCKAARGPKPPAKTAPVPNERVDDLYEVLGQSIKCRRWLEPQKLITQLMQRTVTTKTSKFVVGDPTVLKTSLADVTRVDFEVIVVQPAISTTPKQEVADLLASADGYQQGARLRFWGTSPLA